jgi:eukaryotic translation initiation factor 2C
MVKRSFGLKVGQGLIKVPGRILNCPRVIYKDAEKPKHGPKTIDPRSRAWNMNEIMFSTGKVLTRWSTLFISLPRGRDAFDRQGLAVVMSEFHQKLKRMGVVAAEPKTA